MDERQVKGSGEGGTAQELLEIVLVSAILMLLGCEAGGVSFHKNRL